jgi:phenylalanyl-tRNA synthetase beta chain
VRLVVSWLREFADVPADPKVVAARLAACGFAVESIDGDTIDFEVTANRPDAMSVVGLAREARTAFRAGTPVPRPAARHPTDPVSSGPPADTGKMTVRLDSPLCRRYALATAEVTVAPSPAWLADRLTAAGVRPINAVVDVTNYVMLELGQPMHAFDAAKLSGATLSARLAKTGERLTTLDGEARTLAPSMLVIADRDHAVAVAGVMGGRASEVSATTTRVAIESAYFDPGTVRRTSKRLGLKTEASIRFERGADIGSPVHALERVLALLDQIGAGRATGAIMDVFPAPPEPSVVLLTRAHLDRLVGASIPDDDVERILRGLAFGVSSTTSGWRVTVPTFRIDVERETDLVEEVARHWGFDHVPAALPPFDSPPPAIDSRVTTRGRLTGLLAGAGLQEAVTFTFIERAAAEPFASSADGIVSIANPLSEKFAVLRPSLLPGLLDALVYNRRREADTVRLFEIGSTFSPAGEAARVGWVLTGRRSGHWSGDMGATDLDFFDAKGIAELVAQAGRVAIAARRADDLPWFVDSRAARIVAVDDPAHPVLGQVGQIRPELVARRGLDSGPVFAGEFSIDARIFASGFRAEPHAVRPIPRMPSIVRDLSVVVSESLPAEDVRATIWADPPAALVEVREFDRYLGKSVPAGSVSLSLRLTFRDPARTLTDTEVQQGVDRIVEALTRAHGAVIRGATGSQSE